MAGSASSDEGEDEIYVVEAIVASRYDGLARQWRYQIKWQGYSDEEMTWEPASNLNCPDLLAAFEAKEKKSKSSTKSQSVEPKTTKARRKSVASNSDPKPKSKASTPAAISDSARSKGKGRAKVTEDEDGDSGEGEASIAELDERRAAAKKKAAKERRSSTTRAEDAVADKWEKKKASKDSSARKTDGGNTSVSTGKPKSTEEVKKTQSFQDNTQKAKSSSKTTDTDKPSSKSNSKRIVPRVESDSESSDGPPLKRQNLGKAQSTPKKDPVSSSATPATNSSRSAISNSKPSSKPPSATPSSNSGSAQTSNPLRAMQFKRKPPVDPNPPSRPEATINEPTPSAASNRPPTPPDDPAQHKRADSASKPSSASTKPSVRFADDQESTSKVGSTTRSQPSAQELAERAAEAALVAMKEAETRKQTLASLETRLTSSEYYRRTAVFQSRSMAAACAEAVKISHGNVLRMKGRGVAIICDSRDVMVSGEGIALGLLLMMVGAKMPKQLSEVAVVCVHRRETLAPIEKMYNELVNMKGHHVEFLHFGNDQIVLPILVSGGSLSAIELQGIGWTKIQSTLQNSSIPIADKKELSLSSPFVSIDSSSYLAAGHAQLPPVTLQSEMAEITSLLCWKREQEPAKWRRFIIVVDQVDPAAAEIAKDRGIELCTWVGLTELTRDCIF
ncbi:hypothetical protein JCM3765_007137 [Sporobolomyces pararoseus]